VGEVLLRVLVVKPTERVWDKTLGLRSGTEAGSGWVLGVCRDRLRVRVGQVSRRRPVTNQTELAQGKNNDYRF
jgi:hypothetical protein